MSGTDATPALEFSARPGLEGDLAPLRRLLEDELASGFPPGLSLAVLDAHGVALRAHGGFASVVGEHVPISAATAYDLASLTKIVCTTTCALRAREEKKLDFSDPVSRFLPRFPRPDTTLWHLLTHTSGLVDHRPFYETLAGRAEIEAAVYAEAADSPPGDAVLYSDLNFMLLGWVLEECSGSPLDALFATQVSGPLAMTRTGFCPPPAARRLCAATELDGDQRLAPGLVWGEVHDGNAFALGGVAGHAGLFATLDDLVSYLAALLPGAGPRLFSDDTLSLVSTRQAATGEDVRGVGWRLEPARWGRWEAPTLWHTGFTGTSLLVSLPAGVGVVLLTNAVHPVRRLEEQARLRERIHAAIAEVFA